MNERIKDLAKQSGFVPGGYANVTYADGAKIMTWREHFDNPGSLERFAELIIRECLGDLKERIALRYQGSEKDRDIGYGMEIVYYDIVDKFGVES